MLMTGFQSQFDRQAIHIDHCMDLGRQPATLPATPFVGAMLDACGMLVRPDNRAVDHLNAGIVAMRNRDQDAVPNARASSRHEPVVAGRVGAISLWVVAPRRSRSQDLKDAVQHPPVVHARDPSRLIGRD